MNSCVNRVLRHQIVIIYLCVGGQTITMNAILRLKEGGGIEVPFQIDSMTATLMQRNRFTHGEGIGNNDTESRVLALKFSYYPFTTFDIRFCVVGLGRGSAIKNPRRDIILQKQIAQCE